MFSLKGLARWGARVAGGVGGYALSTNFVSSNFKVGQKFLGLDTVSTTNTMGWDDIVDVACAITAGGLAGKAAGLALYGRKKKKK